MLDIYKGPKRLPHAVLCGALAAAALAGCKTVNGSPSLPPDLYGKPQQQQTLETLAEHFDSAVRAASVKATGQALTSADNSTGTFTYKVPGGSYELYDFRNPTIGPNASHNPNDIYMVNAKFTPTGGNAANQNTIGIRYDSRKPGPNSVLPTNSTNAPSYVVDWGFDMLFPSGTPAADQSLEAQEELVQAYITGINNGAAPATR